MDSKTVENITQTAFCGDLRSKKFFMLNHLPSQPADFYDPSGHCWCYHTQQPVGPDGELVMPERCGPGRGCYRSALSER